MEARRYKVSRDDLDLIISVIKPETCPESDSEGFGGSSESISMEKSDSTEHTPQWAHAFQHRLSSSNSGHLSGSQKRSSDSSNAVKKIASFKRFYAE